MSARNRRRRQTPRPGRAAHLYRDLVPPLSVVDAIDRPDPVVENPAVVKIETEAEREERHQRENAARLPMSIQTARPIRHVQAVPLAELRAWCELYAPDAWAKMQSLKLPRRRPRPSSSRAT